MASQCKMEFYFKTADMLKLLKENKKAKGIIISQEIIQKKGPRGMPANVVLITARLDAQPDAAKAAFKMLSTGEEDIYGCPYPPGCTE